MVERVIVYRNPFEYWLYEEGGALDILIALLIIIGLIGLYYLIKIIFISVSNNIELLQDDDFDLRKKEVKRIKEKFKL